MILEEYIAFFIQISPSTLPQFSPDTTIYSSIYCCGRLYESSGNLLINDEKKIP